MRLPKNIIQPDREIKNTEEQYMHIEMVDRVRAAVFVAGRDLSKLGRGRLMGWAWRDSDEAL